VRHVLLKFSGEILLSSIEKLKDPVVAIKKLPKNSIFILRDEPSHFYEDSYIIFLQKICKKNKILFFVQNKDYAYKYKADGISFKDRDKFVRVVKGRENFIISQSCHDLASARIAANNDRDFILLSPLFKTSTHKNIKPLGIVKFNRIIKKLNIAVIALGGIRSANISNLKLLNIYGFAAIDYFLYDK
jgi:thiamine-phosphate pyrophosphorylase